MADETTQTITLDLSGRAGLVQPIGQNSRTKYEGTAGQFVDGVYNPMMRYGYLSPATSTLTDVTGDQSYAAPMQSSIYDPVNDDFYFAERGSQLFQGDTTNDTTIVRSVIISSSIITDLEIYQVNGLRKLFVLYRTTGNKAEIAISNLPYDSSTDDPTWLSATVSGGFTNGLTGDIFMLSSENGFGYVFMENQVHKIDGNVTGGTNGTITPNVLLFPVTFRLVDAIDYRGSTFIAIHQYNNDTRNTNPASPNTGLLGTGVYIWDRQETTAGSNDYTPIPGAIEICKLFLSPSGNMRAICRMSDGYIMIFEYNGSAFVFLRQVGYNGQPYFRDSLDTLGTLTIWHARDGNLYAFGSVMPGDPEGLFKFFTHSVSATNAGAILLSSGSVTSAPASYIAYQDVSGSIKIGRLPLFNGVGQVSNQLCYTGDVTTTPQFLPAMSTVKSVTFYGANTSTGSTTIATIGIYLNTSNTPWATKTVSLDQMARGYVRFEINVEYVNSIQLQISWPGSLSLGSASPGDFAPSVAIVEYETTTTKG